MKFRAPDVKSKIDGTVGQKNGTVINSSGLFSPVVNVNTQLGFNISTIVSPSINLQF